MELARRRESRPFFYPEVSSKLGRKFARHGEAVGRRPGQRAPALWAGRPWRCCAPPTRWRCDERGERAARSGGRGVAWARAARRRHPGLVAASCLAVCTQDTVKLFSLSYETLSLAGLRSSSVMPWCETVRRARRRQGGLLEAWGAHLMATVSTRGRKRRACGRVAIWQCRWV